jgi:transcriptional regulator with XRE-family HTH domain
MKNNEAITIENLVSLGKVVASYRKEVGLSQQELSVLLSVSRVWISDLERGELTNPGFDRLLTLFETLHIRFVVVPEFENEHSEITKLLIRERKHYDR